MMYLNTLQVITTYVNTFQHWIFDCTCIGGTIPAEPKPNWSGLAQGSHDRCHVDYFVRQPNSAASQTGGKVATRADGACPFQWFVRQGRQAVCWTCRQLQNLHASWRLSLRTHSGSDRLVAHILDQDSRRLFSCAAALPTILRRTSSSVNENAQMSISRQWQ